MGATETTRLYLLTVFEFGDSTIITLIFNAKKRKKEGIANTNGTTHVFDMIDTFKDVPRERDCGRVSSSMIKVVLRLSK